MMKTFSSIQLWQNCRKNIAADQSIGFIPTMGNLHKGHLSLIQRSLKENDFTLVSIFVNPTQFNQKDDFEHYPRTIEADLKLLKEIKADFCLLPSGEAVYPDDFSFQISNSDSDSLMEGLARPGHFRGMLTVVMKLLQIAKPHRAYFGEKDYQQLQLIKNMASAFFLETEIIACETIREESGLAFSSRNSRLTLAEKKLADQFAKIFHQRSFSMNEISEALNQLGLKIEYLMEKWNRRFIAVKIGNIRLIDNYALNKSYSLELNKL